MRCNPSARWGPGTTKERQVDTEGTKELKQKMEQMMKERERQNNMWSKEEKDLVPVFSSTTSSTSKTTTSG